MTTDCSVPWPRPIPTANRTSCALGGGTIDFDAFGVFQWTAGWVEKRPAGGGHGISTPARDPRWACGACVQRASDGLLDQGSLAL